MTKSVDWAISKDNPEKPTKNSGNATTKGGNKQAGKGDKPRHDLNEYGKGYDLISWGRK